MLQLFLLFTLLPAFELWLLMQIGDVIGFAETIFLIIITGIVGASMAKREGLSVLMQIQQEAQRGSPPGDKLVEGLLILVGGVLLVTPGVMTDFFGFSLIFPITRKTLAPLIRKAALARAQNGASFSGTSWNVNISSPRPGPEVSVPPTATPEVESETSILTDGVSQRSKPFKHPIR